MAKSGITKTMILQRIVEKCIKNNIYVNRLDKLIIPKNENDLPPNMKIKSHLEYRKAYNHLYNLKTKPVKVNKPTKMVEPMKAYKEVARTGRVESKKLIINMSSTMTCTILNSGLITVDFK